MDRVPLVASRIAVVKPAEPSAAAIPTIIVKKPTMNHG
tara:strand:- start:1800 stop:1913 length:114 start_codon:yes stop_codon:yes gene_type:complete